MKTFTFHIGQYGSGNTVTVTAKSRRDAVNQVRESHGDVALIEAIPYR